MSPRFAVRAAARSSPCSTFDEFSAEVEDLLLQPRGPARECLDVSRGGG
ncbi:hypothetical protein ACFTZK_07690 [Streptomyces decoyicus]